MLWIVASMLLTQACLDNDTNDPNDGLVQQQMETIESFLAENNIDATEDTRQFYYHAITENPSGTAPKTGDAVSFYYRLSTLEGQLIEEKREGTDMPAKVAFGSNIIKVPVALEASIAMMKEGETYEFFLPSQNAYQNFSKTNLIPQNAIVRMQLKIAEVLNAGEEKQVEDAQIKAYLAQKGLAGADSLTSGVYYIQTEAGDSTAITDGKLVEVRYTGSLLDSTVFDSNLEDDDPFPVAIGNTSVIEGFETGLRQMQEGEKGIILIPSHAGYEGSATIIPRSIIRDLLENGWINPGLGYAEKIPPFAVLRFDIEVESVN